jgi:hypothetical protein
VGLGAGWVLGSTAGWVFGGLVAAAAVVAAGLILVSGEG